MTKRRDLVVIGCPVANRSWCLDQWWENVAQQVLEDNWRAAFVYSDSEDDTLGKLEQMQGWHDAAILYGGAPSSEVPRTREDMDLHRWPSQHFADMARYRNQLLDYCVDVGAEWFFSVDSDIMLPFATYEVLKRQLMELAQDGCYGAIAPLVNMAVHLDAHAYNYMSWATSGGVDAIRPPLVMPDQTFRADVIMAAMLIHRSAFDIRWTEHPQGEDVGWSMDARNRGVYLLVDPTIVCNHLMRRSG